MTAFLTLSLCLGNAGLAEAAGSAYPRDPENTEVKWNRTIDSNPSDYTNSPSQVVELNGYLYIVGGGSLYKLDKDNNIISKQDNVTNGSNVFLTSNGTDTIYVQDCGYNYDFATMKLTYYYNSVRAFDTSKLECKWTNNDIKLTSDSSSDFANSPLTYHDGILYGNNGHSFFALNTSENGKTIWTMNSQKGVKNSAPLVIGNYVIVGDLSGNVYSLNKADGRSPIDTLQIDANQAVYSSFTYADDYIYFISHDPTGKNAPELNKIQLNLTNGKLSNVDSVPLDATDSTTTPTVKDGKIYVGGSKGSNGSDGIVAVYDTDLKRLDYKEISGLHKTFNILAVTDPDDKDNTLLYSEVWGKDNDGTPISLSEKNGILTDPVTYRSLTVSRAANFSDAQITLGSDGTLYYSNDSGVLLALKAKENSGASNNNQPATDPNQASAQGQANTPKTTSTGTTPDSAAASGSRSSGNQSTGKSPVTGENPAFPLLPVILLGLTSATVIVSLTVKKSGNKSRGMSL